MKYKTNHLDEASYLAIKGHKYTTTKFGELKAEWKFESSDKLESHRKQFWGGTAIVNVHKWLCLREILKREQRSMLAVSKDNPFNLTNGQEYWYITEHNTLNTSLFGGALIHKQRMDKGNFFLTQEEALNARNKKKQYNITTEVL